MGGLAEERGERVESGFGFGTDEEPDGCWVVCGQTVQERLDGDSGVLEEGFVSGEREVKRVRHTIRRA